MVNCRGGGGCHHPLGARASRRRRSSSSGSAQQTHGVRGPDGLPIVSFPLPDVVSPWAWGCLPRRERSIGPRGRMIDVRVRFGTETLGGAGSWRSHDPSPGFRLGGSSIRAPKGQRSKDRSPAGSAFTPLRCLRGGSGSGLLHRPRFVVRLRLRDSAEELRRQRGLTPLGGSLWEGLTPLGGSRTQAGLKNLSVGGHPTRMFKARDHNMAQTQHRGLRCLLYKRLIARRRPVRVFRLDDWGLPWIRCNFRKKDGGWGYHTSAFNHDGWVRVRPRS